MKVTRGKMKMMNHPYRYIGLEVLSCWRDTELEGVARGNMQLQIGHNHFEHNEKVAVKLAPLVRAEGRIEHNDFLHNKDGCLYTHNEDDFILEIQPVDLTVFENRFVFWKFFSSLESRSGYKDQPIVTKSLHSLAGQSCDREIDKFSYCAFICWPCSQSHSAS